MDDIPNKVFRFEGFTIDVTRRVLRRGDQDVELRPKSFDVLASLVAEAGRVVSKDEIIERVWSDVNVTDESLTRCVSDVRLALGDGDQRIIKTIPRRGYLLAVPLAAVESTAASEASISPATEPAAAETVLVPARWVKRNWPLRITAACAVLLLIAIGTGVRLWRQPGGLPLPVRPFVAVLPFVNMAGDPQQDYFSDGISEDLTTSLSKFGELSVIARGSAFKYKGQGIDVTQVGRELGVRFLVQGSVRKDAERLRVTARLIETETGRELWAERYDREPGGVFAVQDDITQRIVARLVAGITKSELDRALMKPPEALVAYDYYLRGNALMKTMQYERRGETTAAARALYEQALAADPRYAPAMQALANTFLMGWLEPSSGHPIGQEFEQQSIIDHAQALAQKAVELDGTLAEARATLGTILYWQNRLAEGLAEFERAFEFNPNYVDARFAVLLAHGGRAPEEIEYVRRIMRLDPLYPPQYTYFLGKGFFYIGKYEQAIEYIRPVSARLPGYRPALVLLAAVAGHLGRLDEAHAAAAEVLRIQPNFTIARWLKWLRLLRQEDADRVAEGLRKAGLPE